MFPCLGGPRLWPLTAKAGLFHAPLDQVVKLAQPWKGNRDSPWQAVRHPSLDAALAAHAPYPYGRDRAVFAVASRDGDWTAVFTSAVPGGDVVAFLQARALFDVNCEFVGVEWLPRAGDVLANATFAHFRPAPRKRFRSPQPPGDTRWIQASDQDGRWEFTATGEPRAFEQPDRYGARRVADRLGLDLLQSYLAALGVPVDNAGWLTGPAVAAVRAPMASEPAWSTVDDLRRLIKYPDDRIPEKLV